MAKFKKRDGFDEKLESFVGHVQRLTNEYFQRKFPKLRPDKITTDPLLRYVRIWRTTDDGDGQMLSWGFVEYATGDIFKCATWRAPAKHARGNIFSEKNGTESINPDGVNIFYIR